MPYRTKTYIAAEWDGDEEAVKKLREWNDGEYWSLSFTDAHDLTQARDSSLYCSIKKSLKMRLNVSKTFVLIVGRNTRSVRKGSCQYCGSYDSRTCSADYRSYIEYECDYAVRNALNIVVLYNAATVDKSRCPDVVKDIGYHAPMQQMYYGSHRWDYQSVKKAMEQ